MKRPEKLGDLGDELRRSPPDPHSQDSLIAPCFGRHRRLGQHRRRGGDFRRHIVPLGLLVVHPGAESLGSRDELSVPIAASSRLDVHRCFLSAPSR